MCLVSSIFELTQSSSTPLSGQFQSEAHINKLDTFLGQKIGDSLCKCEQNSALDSTGMKLIEGSDHLVKCNDRCHAIQAWVTIPSSVSQKFDEPHLSFLLCFASCCLQTPCPCLLMCLFCCLLIPLSKQRRGHILGVEGALEGVSVLMDSQLCQSVKLKFLCAFGGTSRILPKGAHHCFKSSILPKIRSFCQKSSRNLSELPVVGNSFGVIPQVPKQDPQVSCHCTDDVEVRSGASEGTWAQHLVTDDKLVSMAASSHLPSCSGHGAAPGDCHPQIDPCKAGANPIVKGWQNFESHLESLLCLQLCDGCQNFWDHTKHLHSHL